MGKGPAKEPQVLSKLPFSDLPFSFSPSMMSACPAIRNVLSAKIFLPEDIELGASLRLA